MISLLLALLIGCGGDKEDTARGVPWRGGAPGADTSDTADTADTSDTADTAETVTE